jgi:hypothetical protein
MMRSHPFDAVSAALGLVACAIGVLVAFDGTDSIDTGWWLALGALVVGLGLVPWTRGQPSAADGDADPATSTTASRTTASSTVAGAGDLPR